MLVELPSGLAMNYWPTCPASAHAVLATAFAVLRRAWQDRGMGSTDTPNFSLSRRTCPAPDRTRPALCHAMPRDRFRSYAEAIGAPVRRQDVARSPPRTAMNRTWMPGSVPGYLDHAELPHQPEVVPV